MDRHSNPYKPSDIGKGRKELQYIFEIITCDPSIYTMNHPDLFVCSFIENSIGLKRGKLMLTPLNYIR